MLLTLIFPLEEPSWLDSSSSPSLVSPEERGGLGLWRGRALKPADSYLSGNAFRNLRVLANEINKWRYEFHTDHEDLCPDGDLSLTVGHFVSLTKKLRATHR